jgi:poly-beta-1,6-N-acetyl-D-glucosamine biosynthesis protein PgaD
MSEFIVNHPNLQTSKRRYGDSLLFWFGWITWLHFWQPLLTLLGWGSSLWITHQNFLSPNLVNTLMGYAFILLFLVLMMIGWLTHLYYQDSRQQQIVQPIFVENSQKMVHDFGITTDTLSTLQTAKRITMSLDDHGKIIKIVICRSG